MPIREARDDCYEGLSKLDPENQEYKSLENKANKFSNLDKSLESFLDSISEDAMITAAETGTKQLKKLLFTSKEVRINVGKNNYHYPAGSFIPKVAETIAKIYEELKGSPLSSGLPKNLLTLRNLKSYKDLEYLGSDKYRKQIEEKSKLKFEVVFSTAASDLLSMSIRGNWTSCQNLMKDKTEHNPKAIYSSISPYVGIIYLTSKMPYQERGEEMIARSLVFYVEHKQNKTPALTIGKVYSNFYTNVFYEKFEKLLKERSRIPVISYDDAVDNYYFPTENIDPSMNPYFDPPSKGKKNIELRRINKRPIEQEPNKLTELNEIDWDV